MEISKLENIIEAVLFISGEGVELGRIADMFEMDMGTAEKIADNYMDKYNFEGHGLKIIKYNDIYQLTTNPEYADYIAKFAGTKKPMNLSNAALEVLAIIAYNQPVTRSTIDKIRGVDSFGPLDKLVTREIVEEKGRLDAPGMPILYGTTPEFLKLFGLKSLEDVPDLDNMQLSITDTLSEEESGIIDNSEEEEWSRRLLYSLSYC